MLQDEKALNFIAFVMLLAIEQPLIHHALKIAIEHTANNHQGCI